MSLPGLSFSETPGPMSFCDITKAKSRLNGLHTTHDKSGKLKKIHWLIFMFIFVYKGTESLFFRLKILFTWKIIVVEVTETILS